MPHYTLDELSHIDLHQLDGQHLSTHGFIHRTKEGETLLATLPNVPSCCLGALGKRSQQLYIQGTTDGLPDHQMAYIEGKFAYLQEQDQWKMVLKEARPMSHESQHSFTPFWIIGVTILSVIIFKKYLKVHPKTLTNTD